MTVNGLSKQLWVIIWTVFSEKMKNFKLEEYSEKYNSTWLLICLSDTFGVQRRCVYPKWQILFRNP
jgi:hypothetical protein